MTRTRVTPPRAKQWLERLVEDRASYPAFAEAVDRDLAIERERRLAERRADIESSVVRAYIEGASLADIKRAYGTKDHQTVRSIIDAHAAFIALARQGEDVEAIPEKWMGYDAEQGTLSILLDGDEAVFTVITLEGDEYLLDFLTGTDALKSRYDGTVLTATDSDESLVALWTEVHDKQ